VQARLWVLVAALVTASLHAPVQVHACSCAGGLVTTVPQNAATDVPRNRPIVLHGPVDPASVVLQTVGGVPHAFEVRAFQQGGPCGGDFAIEVLPTTPLDAQTEYELRAELKANAPGAVSIAQPPQVRFTTGDTLLPDPELAPPTADLRLVAPPRNMSTSCGPLAANGCVKVDDPRDVMLILRNGDNVFMEIPLSAAETPLSWFQMPTCVDVVRQSATGRRSQPVSFCGDALKLAPTAANACEEGIFGNQRPTAMDEPSPAPTAPTAPMAAAGAAAPLQLPAEEPAVQQAAGCSTAPGNAVEGELMMFALLSLAAGLWLRRGLH
jgi:hypothetical protein